jgi:hypothetical protein
VNGIGMRQIIATKMILEVRQERRKENVEDQTEMAGRRREWFTRAENEDIEPTDK